VRGVAFVLMIASGFLLLDVVVALAWQEPLTAVIARAGAEAPGAGASEAEALGLPQRRTGGPRGGGTVATGVLRVAIDDAGYPRSAVYYGRS
jgi:hypothetical protein